MDISVGKAIRKIKKDGLNSAYFLLGDDAYLQNVFINYIKEKFDNKIKIKYLDLNDNIDNEIFFNDIDSISLFNTKNIFIIRNFDKVSNKNKEFLSGYIKKQNKDNILVFVVDDYMIKNKFYKEVYSSCVKIDTNTPFFNSKIKDWAKFYMNKNNIVLDDQLINYLVDSYGDNIGNVISEIEKIFLIINKRKVKSSDYNSTYKNRNLKYWNLMNSLGLKDMKQSIKIFESLLSSGISIIPIVSNLGIFYSYLLDTFNNNNNNMSSFRLNNTIKKRIFNYREKYSYEEVSNIIIEMRNMDIISKSSAIDDNLLFYPFAIKICKGYYV